MKTTALKKIVRALGKDSGTLLLDSTGIASAHYRVELEDWNIHFPVEILAKEFSGKLREINAKDIFVCQEHDPLDNGNVGVKWVDRATGLNGLIGKLMQSDRAIGFCREVLTTPACRWSDVEPLVAFMSDDHQRLMGIALMDGKGYASNGRSLGKVEYTPCQEGLSGYIPAIAPELFKAVYTKREREGLVIELSPDKAPFQPTAGHKLAVAGKADRVSWSSTDVHFPDCEQIISKPNGEKPHDCATLLEKTTSNPFKDGYVNLNPETGDVEFEAKHGHSESQPQPPPWVSFNPELITPVLSLCEEGSLYIYDRCSPAIALAGKATAVVMPFHRR